MHSKRRLHVTNGDVTARLLREAGARGPILPWRDVLHEGPVPEGLGGRELRRVRAKFLAGRAWGKEEAILRQLERRDEELANAFGGRIVLWFEHDLYDQLQLLQILDALAAAEATEIEWICIDGHPEVEPFYGLGQLSASQLAGLWPQRSPLTREQLEAASRAWAAFRASDPESLQDLIAEGCEALPFLAAALRRHLEQLPAVEGGLGRTERQALEVLATHGELPAGELFRRQQELEESPFLGDSPFFSYLEELASPGAPLVLLEPSAGGGAAEAGVRLAPAGERVLAGAADRVALRGLDRWWGGFHSRGRTCPWRWDPEAGRLAAVAS